METRSGGLRIPSHSFNTRSNAARNNRSSEPERIVVPRLDSSVYFTGGRPAFTEAVENIMYGNPQANTPRFLYRCKTGGQTYANLPREGDATQQEINAGQYATIGHIVQWQEYIAANCEPVGIDCQDGRYCAYKLEDVRRLFNDTNNLELQSQHYNSQIGHHHSGDLPLLPWWE